MITKLLDRSKIEECDRAILLIRHGEKVQPPEEDPFRDVELTENGVRMSFKLGEELGAFVDKDDCGILSSPLKRCTQTAENVIKGLGAENYPIEISHILGDPGPYVEDEDLAGKTFLKVAPQNRNLEIIKMQLEHHPLPGFRDIEEGSKLLLEYLFSTCHKKICIAITHDTTIIPLIGFLYGEIVELEEWINYLDGILFCIKGRKVMMYTKKSRILI